MNLEMVKWLIAHRDILLSIADAAKEYDRNAPYIEQWNVVDKIARLVIPALQEESVDVQSLQLETYEDDYVAAFTLGGAFASIGVDWRLIIEIIIPMLTAILQALAQEDDE